MVIVIIMLLLPKNRKFLQNIRIININKKVNTCLRVILFIIFITNSKSSTQKFLFKIKAKLAKHSVLVNLQRHEV